MKAVTVVGARPQFIKLAPFSKEFRKKHEEVIVHTGQHYDGNLSQLFFDELQIPHPDYNLEVGSSSHGVQTGKMLAEIESVLIKEKPDIVIVFGDTNSTLAGALAASKLNIQVAHIEAGMRNFDRQKPEEINRILTDHISNFLFAATDTAVSNLKSEGITRGVFQVGDVTFEAIQRNKLIADKNSQILKKLGLQDNEYIVLTIHKSKNTDSRERLSSIVKSVVEIKDKIIFPIHPRTRKYLKEYNLWDDLINSQIVLTDPLGYLDFLKLLSHSKKIVTDSGGIQREAYVFSKPCITLRETEWVETLNSGWNIEINLEHEELIQSINCFYPKTPQPNIFGDGKTCENILKILDGYF